MGVRVDLNVSLDGDATTEGGTPDNPLGDDWSKLTAAYVAHAHVPRAGPPRHLRRGHDRRR